MQKLIEVVSGFDWMKLDKQVGGVNCWINCDLENHYRYPCLINVQFDISLSF